MSHLFASLAKPLCLLYCLPVPFSPAVVSQQDYQYINPQVRLPRIPILKEREIRDWLDKNPYNPRRFEIGEGEEGDEVEAEPAPPVPSSYPEPSRAA